MLKTLGRLVLIAVLIGVPLGCSGGSGSGVGVNPDGSGSSGTKNFITVAPGQLEFRTFVTDTTYSTQKKTVHVEFEGHGVLAGYASDVTPPIWLNIPSSTIEAPGKQFDLTVGCLPIVSQTAGTYTTSVRLLTGNLDGSDTAYVDLAIQLIIEAPPPVYDGGIAFEITTADATLPLPQNILLDFGAFTGADFSVAIESLNSFAHDWVSADPDVEDGQLDVAIIANPSDGHYKANLILTYQAAGATGRKSIPVDFTVSPAEPSIHYVSPPFAYIDRSSEFIISGVGFTTATIQEITLGGTPAAAFELVNDSQIRARFPAFDTAGSRTLVLSTDQGMYAGPSDIVVKQPVNAVYTNVDMGSEILDFEFDAVRDALIAATTTGLYRLQNTGGGWQTVTQQAIDVRSFDLTPDGKHIVYSDGAKLHLLDVETLVETASYEYPALGTSGGAAIYSHAPVKHVLSNGDVLLVLRITPQEAFCTFHLPNQIFTTSEQLSETTLTRITTSREKCIIVPNAIASNYSGYYMAGSQTFEPLTLPQDRIYSNRLALSGNGERIYLDDGIYDKDLNFLLNITDGAVSNYSTELSFDGGTAYWIDAGNGKIHTYDISTAPAIKTGITSFVDPYASYAAFPETRITPDNGMMILGKGMRNASTPETRLVFVPLNPI